MQHLLTFRDIFLGKKSDTQIISLSLCVLEQIQIKKVQIFCVIKISNLEGCANLREAQYAIYYHFLVLLPKTAYLWPVPWKCIVPWLFRILNSDWMEGVHNFQLAAHLWCIVATSSLPRLVHIAGNLLAPAATSKQPLLFVVLTFVPGLTKILAKLTIFIFGSHESGYDTV